MKLGFSPVSGAMLDLDAAFRLAVDLGLDFVELSFDLHEALPHAQPAERVRELTRATGVGTTVHLSYVDLNLASLIPAARRTSVERTQMGLEFADAVGASCGVLHTGMNYVPFEQARMLAWSALDESLGLLAGSRVPIALENLVLTDYDLVRDAQQLATLTEKHGMGNCLDIGHANIESHAKGAQMIKEYASSMGDNLLHLHLHDNFGVWDEHLPTGQGNIDFGEVQRLFGDFTGTACLEITAGEAGVREAVAHLAQLGMVPA